MRFKPTPVVVTLYLLGLFTFPGMAATPEKKIDNAKLVGTLTERTEVLEQQIQELQSELNELKKESRAAVQNQSSTVQNSPAKQSSPIQNSTAEQSSTEEQLSPRRQHPSEKPLMKYRVLLDHATGRHYAVPIGPCLPRSSAPPCSSASPCYSNREEDVAPGPYINAAQGESENVENAEKKKTAHPLNTEAQQQVPPAEREPLDQVSAGGADAGYAPLKLLINAPFTFGGMPLVTSPYLGQRTEFDGSDLITNYPNTQLGIRLLEQRQKIENVFKEHKIPLPDQPYVDVSGSVQPIAFVSRPYVGPRKSGFDVPTLNLDFFGNINRWVDTFIRFSFDNDPLNVFIPDAFGPIVSNSRVFLDQGFIQVGNLNCSPFYMTMGQFIMPFGRYSTNMVSSPLTASLAKTKARAVLLGYNEPGKYDGLDVQIYAFKGDSRTSITSDRINNGGAYVSYLLDMKCWHFKIGGSYISNMADSFGMQLNGAGVDFQGFGGPVPDNAEVLEHRVPGAGVNGEIGIGPIGLIGEYITATRRFAPGDITFNCRGAKPSASNIEAVYNFKICNLPTSIAVGYQTTRQSLAFLLPKNRYIGVFNISLWKDTVQSLEFHHDENYDCGDFATGQGVPVFVGNTLGRTSNALIFQFAAFF